MTKELALSTIESGLEIIKENKYSTIVHSDRGSQFTSQDYKDLLLKNGLTQSMSIESSKVSDTSPEFSVVFAPRWSDVCTHSAYWDISTTRKYLKSEKKYCQTRKIQFEKEVEMCKVLEAPSVCYKHIVQLENERTKKWEMTYYDEREQRSKKTTAIVGVTGFFVSLFSIIAD